MRRAAHCAALFTLTLSLSNVRLREHYMHYFVKILNNRRNNVFAYFADLTVVPTLKMPGFHFDHSSFRATLVSPHQTASAHTGTTMTQAKSFA